jgi:NAD(P)-dependent dehydrogenase (short-subunit alcohol dehydrogenase family)
MALPFAPSDLVSLSGKVVLLTGGGRGLGRMMASGLAAAGARLAIAGRDGATLEAAAREIGEECGAAVACYTVDLADRASTIRMSEQLVKDHGRVDILVHNASQEGIELIEDVTEAQIDNILETNLVSAILMARAFVPGMKANGYGRLIFITSATTAVAGDNGHSVYTASKSGIEGFCRTLAVELGRSGVTANCISPGVYMTDQARRAMESYSPEAAKAAVGMFASMTAVGRWGNPEDLVAPLLMLANEHSRYVTGEVLRVDGGLAVRLHPS